MEFDSKLYSEDKKIEQVFVKLDELSFSMKSSISKKADLKDFEKFQHIVLKKADNEQVNNVCEQLRIDFYEEINKLVANVSATKRSLEEITLERKNTRDLMFEKVQNEIDRVNDDMRIFIEEYKKDLDENQIFIQNLNASSKKEIEREFDMINEALSNIQINLEKKLEKKEFNEFKNKTTTLLGEKVDVSEVQNALNISQADISSNFVKFKEDIKQLLFSNINELYSAVNQKCDKSEFQSNLSSKVDSMTLQNILREKVGIVELEEMKSNFNYIFKSLEEKLVVSEFEKNFERINKNIEDLYNEINNKANTNELVEILENKPDIGEVNKLMKEVYTRIENKSEKEELNNVINDQAMINESLCTENIIGRWTWKTGELKGVYIPWEVQVVNTLPDNFIWEKDKPTIMVVAPGLYEVSFGFYSRKPPVVQLLVNSESIITVSNQNSNTTQKEMVHPSGNIIGLTGFDFLVLPSRARISFNYTGEYGAEGFFGIKRL